MSATASTIPTRPGPELLRQIVVIIGGSAGIGLETARRARAEGASIILTGRNRERLEQAARELGDILVLALNSDRSVRENKGANRPIIPEDERAEIAAALAAVDYVVLFDEPTPREIIARVLPDVLVKGSDWGADEIVGREEVEAVARPVRAAAPRRPRTSSTLCRA